MSKGKVYDFTDQVRRAWEHFDALLDVKIQHIHELTGVEKERLIKLNPAEVIRDKWDNVYIKDYHYPIRKWAIGWQRRRHPTIS